MPAWLWAAIGVVLIMMESAHGAFIVSMLGTAALLTALFALLVTHSLSVTLPLFVLFSIAGLVLVRPWAVRHVRSWPGSRATNVQSFVGQTVRLVRGFGPDGIGYVVVGAENWRARLADGWEQREYPVGSELTVLGVEGTTLQVCPEVLAESSQESHASQM